MIQSEKRIKFSSGNDRKSRLERLSFLERHSQTSLSELTQTNLTTRDVDGNIEGFLGSIEIPVGLAGPLKINWENENSEYIYAPIATSEGALIFSMSRGAQAVNIAGGVQTKVIRQRMSRAPMFCFNTMKDADRFCSWVEDKFIEIKKITKKYSNYANLIDIEAQLFGRNVHLRFEYETGDASGQNMTTTCTWNACLWIEDQFNSHRKDSEHILNYVIEANGSSDKKVSKKSTIATRGIRVISECHLSEKVIKRVLKTTSKDLVNLYLKAIPIAVNDGMVGYNVNVANAIAGFFAATGQDLACIHESAVGIMQMELTDKGLYIAITLPSLVIGTVGGGVSLKGPKEVLKILGCDGAGKVERLAQIIAGYCLGLELSTMSAITSGQFATSHERLGRNHPIDLLREHELDLNFFHEQLNLSNITEVKSLDHIEIQNGIVSEVTSKVSKKLIGFYPFAIKEKNNEYTAVLKLKPLDEEVLLGFEIIAGLVSKDLKTEYEGWKDKNAFISSHTKEIEAYRTLNRSHPHLIPKFYGLTQVPEREIYGFLQEFLNKDKLTHFNSEDAPESWTFENKKSVIAAISEIHSDYFESSIISHFANKPVHLKTKIELTSFYLEVTKQAQLALNWFTKAEKSWFDNIVNNANLWYPHYLKQPVTLVHNDFSPRNLCLRADQTPCIYDWELCQRSAPQRDFIEFMAFTKSKIDDEEEFKQLTKIHYQNFKKMSDSDVDYETWKQGLLASAYEFLTDRISFYMIGNIINQYKFLERVYKSTKYYIQFLQRDVQEEF